MTGVQTCALPILRRKDEPDTRLAGRSTLPKEGVTWGLREGGAAEVEDMERLP